MQGVANLDQKKEQKKFRFMNLKSIAEELKLKCTKQEN